MESKNQKMSAVEVKMQLLRDGIKNKEENDSNTDFSIHITLQDEPSKKVPVIERSSGLENFESAMEQAKKYTPETIIVHTFRNKTDRKGSAWVFKVAENREEPQKPLKEQISDAVKGEMDKLTDTLSGTEDSSTLGAIQKYEHLGEILTLKSEKQLTELQHKQELAELNRQITEKHEIIESNNATITGLEKENKKIADEYEVYKSDKMAGVTKSISQAGLAIVSNLASQYLPKLMGAGSAAMAGVNEGQKTTIVEDDDPRSILIDQIRLIIAEYDQDTFVSFYRLMELIASDSATISIVLELLEPNLEKDKNNGGAE